MIKRIMSFVSVVLILSACTSANNAFAPTAEYLFSSPEPPPESITIATRDVEFSESQCVEVYPEAFWTEQIGFNAGRLNEHLQKNTHIAFDAETVEEVNVIMLLGVHYVREEGEVVGSYGAGITFCADTSHLKRGYHLGTVEITGLEGDIVTHSWGFHVD